MGDIPPLMKQAADEQNRLFFELIIDLDVFRYQILSCCRCCSSNDTVNYSFQALDTKTPFEQVKYSLSNFCLGSTDINEESEVKIEDQLEEQSTTLHGLKEHMQVFIRKNKAGSTTADYDSD